ncbi:MAG: hypothetical protein MUC34_11535 [Anaerolineae bacterium]|jgi:hypothetical protein|nr:hypothetical protein [Anaerolineae bacterium]
MTAFDLSLPDSEPDDRYRRRIGLLIGGALGLAYGVFSQLGNRLLAPGVPLYQPPLGAWLNTLVFTLGGAALGLLVAWPRSGMKGVFLMAAAGAAGIVLLSLATARGLSESFALRLVSAITLALPFWGMLVPIFAAVRWVIGHQEEAHRDGQNWRGRLLWPGVLIALVAVVGYTSIYPARGRETLRVANAMLSEAVASGATPDALAQVDGFEDHLREPYRLAWEGTNISRYRIARPSENFDFHSAVVARYSSGWNLVCIYVAEDKPPLCRGFNALPR